MVEQEVQLCDCPVKAPRRPMDNDQNVVQIQQPAFASHVTLKGNAPLFVPKRKNGSQEEGVREPRAPQGRLSGEEAPPWGFAAGARWREAPMLAVHL